MVLQVNQPVFMVEKTAKGGAQVQYAAGKGSAAKAAKPALRDFAKAVFAHADAEDLAAYSEAEREQAAQMAADALAGWRRGRAVIELKRDALPLGADKVSVLTLVNTNKPFLFDSVMAEIYGRSRCEGGVYAESIEAGAAEGAAGLPAVYLVAHPVFAAAWRGEGELAVSLPQSEAGLSAAAVKAEAAADEGAARVSLIQIHLKFTDAAQAEKLVQALKNVVDQVRLAHHDRAAIGEALAALAADYQAHLPEFYAPQRAQALEFMAWLKRGNFIFLGLREYSLAEAAAKGKSKAAAAELLPRHKREGGRELGILTDSSIRILRSEEKTETEKQLFSFMRSDELMLITKARTRSAVHRNAFLDYIGFKLFDVAGKVSGELRLVGLFTARAYHASVLQIPYLKPKAEAVLAALGYDKTDHSGRALLHILETYPRDDLFRLSEAELAANAARILELGERPRLRLLANADQFGHFVSLLIFVPRDRYNTQTRRAIGALALRLYDGDFYEYEPRFFDENLTSLHLVVHRRSGLPPKVDLAQAEAEIAAAIGTWEDKIAALAKKQGADKRLAALARALPQAYRDMFSPAQGLADAAILPGLTAERPLYVEFDLSAAEDGKGAGGAAESGAPGRAALKLFHRGGQLPLSRRVPLLENMGFGTIAEQTIEISAAALAQAGLADAAPVFIHDMELAAPAALALVNKEGRKTAAALADLFAAVWAGEGADDGFNALAQTAGLPLNAIFVLRAYGRYLQQAGIPYSQERLAATLSRYPELAATLYQFFYYRFSPQAADKAQAAKKLAEAEAKIAAGLRQVPALDDDRTIRAFRNLIEASLRTNAFSCADKYLRGETLAFKFDPHKIDGLAEPRPYREIFVYGPQVEGVHLRFGSVARGGIRWSDRGQDYRTEVLGLVKAQQVKNAVIVPVGAKGGFYPHNIQQITDKAAFFEAGRSAYKIFISAMLAITDNIVQGKIVPALAAPVRHDGDDPYFVVAADKGTASFSDTANAISQAEHFWLDDAFASGGSEGYDHKKMGITAKGAWEAVKRHFREMGRNIQAEPFTAAGVGDMSGDVFGNGMLLSDKTKLVAAFDHHDIFLDPNPDSKTSHAERARLFALPRSGWQDYDKSKISKGGGVFSRAEKYIALSPEAAAAIGFDKAGGTPFEIIAAILRAPVDLLFFGGIGTYIRGAQESNAQVGDRANDAVRIEGREVRAKVVGEGANLGVTQNGRVEYAAAGGRINTDAIDNSAGVNCSDIEVNIKIAFAAAMSKGKLARSARNDKLRAMTGEVAKLILRNNYQQTLALSLGQRRALALLPAQIRFMNSLEKRGLLARAVEALPDNRILAERQEHGAGLRRPELAVLLAYAKNTLEAELVNSSLTEEAYCEQMLFAYFPAIMHEEFAAEIRGHRLRRDIIATVLANNIINRGGASFVARLMDKTGRSAEDVLRAYIIVRDGFGLEAVYAEIDALDNKISGDVQNSFYETLSQMIFSATSWILRNIHSQDALAARVERMKAVFRTVAQSLPELLPDYWRARLAAAEKAYAGQGAPAHLATELAMIELASVIPDIILVARTAKAQAPQAANVYFALTELFGMARLESQAARIPVHDYYDGLALEQAQNLLAESLRKIAAAVLADFGGKAEPVAAWRQADTAGRIGETAARLQTLAAQDMSISRLTVAAGILADLAAAAGAARG